MMRMSPDYRREGQRAQGSGGIKGGRVDAGVGNEREDAAKPARQRLWFEPQKRFSFSSIFSDSRLPVAIHTFVD